MPTDTAIEEKEIRLADIKLAGALWPHIRPFLWMLALSTLFVFIVTFFELSIPIFIQKAIDTFIIPMTQDAVVSVFSFRIESFYSFCLVFLGFICSAFLFDFIQTLFMEYTGQKIILNLRCTLFTHMTFLPVSYFDGNTSGRLVSRVAGDIENMNEMFTSILIFIFKDLLMMGAIFVILFNINARLALYLSILLPVIGFSILFFSKVLRDAFRTIRQKIAEINHSFSEAVNGIRIIQTTSSRLHFIDRFKRLNFEHFTAALLQIRIFSIFMPFIGFLGVLSVAVIIWTGSFQVESTQLTIGELVAFLTYMKLFFRPLRELAEKFNLLQSALASAERIVIILNTPQASQRQSRHRNRIDAVSNLSFKNVDFSYDKNKPVLRDISFSLGKGRSIGIVGRTGSGKSSIINLITGFYTPDHGTIALNGVNQDSVNIRDIRDKTALVMQDPILFSGNIRDNITPASPDINDTVLIKALEDANCAFVFDKFDGLDTLIKQGGSPLSSGEKQLVCIARAFAFNPDLIIFDEATSYMDSQSEQQVHDAMNKLMKGRLSIIIAHRLSTVRECDTILLLRDGKIVERGSHDELAALKGEYYHLLSKEKI